MRFSYVAIACLLGLIAVALGAFGAHAIGNVVSEARLATWTTAVQYHFFHVLAVLVLSAVFRDNADRWVNRAQASFLVGVGIFSGSLYVLVLTDTPALGVITPVGGLLLMLGWLFAFVAAVKAHRSIDAKV